MCVSLLERVKQGKSNIILILILSARSQDRDRATTLPHLASIMISIHSVARPRRQDAINSSFVSLISIHSVARPRRIPAVNADDETKISIHSVARPRHTNIWRWINWRAFQSTRSQDRDSKYSKAVFIHKNFNPLGRKTETRARQEGGKTLTNFNPLGRKTETKVSFSQAATRPFQSTRSQDRDCEISVLISSARNFNPLGRKTETYLLPQFLLWRPISIHSVARPRRGTIQVYA